jgi:hypothetical protein
MKEKSDNDEHVSEKTGFKTGWIFIFGSLCGIFYFYDVFAGRPPGPHDGYRGDLSRVHHGCHGIHFSHSFFQTSENADTGP